MTIYDYYYNNMFNFMHYIRFSGKNGRFHKQIARVTEFCETRWGGAGNPALLAGRVRVTTRRGRAG